jgi:hypothetical protein
LNLWFPLLPLVWREKVADLAPPKRKVSALSERNLGFAKARGRMRVALWKPCEVTVVGSGRGPLAQVFLGSNGNRIIRNAPVPMIVVPTMPMWTSPMMRPEMTKALNPGSLGR